MRLRTFKFFMTLFFLLGTTSRAEALLETSLFYFTDSLVTDDTATNTTTYLDLSYSFKATKSNWLWIGWTYGQHSNVDANENSYTSTGHGPRFLFWLGRKGDFTLALSYLLVAKASYSAGGATAQEWQGTALRGEFGYAQDLTETLKLGIKLNYLSFSFSEEFVGEAFTPIAYTRTVIMPAISLSWDF